jgi:hypothetical protein
VETRQLLLLLLYYTFVINLLVLNVSFRVAYNILYIIIILCRVPFTPCITRDRRHHRLSSRRRRRRFCAADRRCRRRRRRRATHRRRKFCNRRRSPIAPGRDAEWGMTVEVGDQNSRRGWKWATN